MGPVIMVPDDVAQRLITETDLVEVADVMADAVDTVDVRLGSMPGDLMVLKERPRDGYGQLVSLVAASEYAKSAPQPFELTVSDKDGNPHPFSGSSVNEQSIQEHLKLAYFGEPGDRRPLLPG